MIMVFFAIDNVYRVHQNEMIEKAATISDGLLIALQFFLLGVSAIYIIQNFIMLTGFLPGNGSFFNAKYFREVRGLKAEHIDRYSDRQVSVGYSVLCVCFATTVFFLNYYYQFLPSHLAIWTVFVVFPFFLRVFGHVTGMSRLEFDER